MFWLTDTSQCFQIARVAHFSTLLSFSSSVTTGRKFSVYSACSMLLWTLLQQWFNLQYVVTTTDLVFRKILSLMVWQTSCWNGCDVVLKVVVMIFICATLKPVDSWLPPIFAKFSLQLCKSVQNIRYNCELFSYCYMRFILIRPKNWASPRTWLSKFRSQNCQPRASHGASVTLDITSGLIHWHIY